ncbi:ABC transporter ATP-binding protein [Nitrospira moscoviensis]|uniref:Multidrug resistance ABC transporter ATP-binding and permease n=1 Tax=Nitrospira moscoviensis TaxID=42253 RepID=A0A0K2GDZ0_NITMO|nr:ABC transporter ATP-binding protein [Nitrospira moscoviensis]ALA58822.1 Multidrug resistance ABC transporter ATP-binding and permease [Nitrospira moscoviensis]
MKPLLRVLQYLRPHRGLATATLLCAACATAMELVPPWVIKIIIDDVIQAGQLWLLPWVAGGLVAAYGLKYVFASLRIRFNNRLEQTVVHDLRSHLFAALQRLSITYFENRSTGEIMSRVTNDTEHVERIFIDGLEGALTASLTLTGITIMLFSLNWRLAALALLPIPLLMLSAGWFTRTVHGYYQVIRRKSAELSGYLQDALSGIRETMGFGRQAAEQKRFDRLSREYSESNLRAMYLWSLYSPGMMFLGSLGTVLILWYGAGEVANGRLTLGELVLFLSYLGLFYVPINQIHSVNHMLQHALAASERVFEVLDAVPEVADRPGAVAPIQKVQGAVVFDSVQFHYRPDVPVIKGFTIAVTPGERVALVGPSGAGKSTLLKLLMRFYDVTEGAILIDGTDIRDVPLAYLRKQIGYVQQEPFLFNGTVRDNLLYGDGTATQARIEAAARAARAHEFIAALPEGYDTWIGERGVKLSVGQKQRVSIARVLLKDPPIVVFDEATSNIDTETEVQIREALHELTKGRTTFIIAHRLSTLQDVDRILVLDGGRLVEEGRHEELLALGGVYAGLYDAQFQL